MNYEDSGFDIFLNRKPQEENLKTDRSKVETLHDTRMGPGGSLTTLEATDALREASITRGIFSGKFIGIVQALELGVATTIAGRPVSLNGGDPFIISVTSPTAAGSSHTHTYTPGSLYLTHAISDLRGSANTDSENADAAAAPTNDTYIAAYVTFTAAAGVLTIGTQPDIGRNVCIVIQNDSGGALNLYEGVTSFDFIGVWKGAAQTESITFTSTAGNKSVANTQFRYKYGLKPFDTITSCTITGGTPAGGLKVAIGIGSKVGLYNSLKTPAEADVVKVSKNAAAYPVTSLVDTTNMTVNLAALTNGDDVMIVYKTADGSGTLTSESSHTHAITAGTATKYLVEYTP